jgi:HSP20 family molecular chaperone IbpA
MEVDKSAAAVQQKKHEQELESQRLQMDLARATRDREKLLAAEREKGEKQLVEISQQANNQLESTKKLNSERVHALSDNTQKNYEALALKTAEEIKHVDAEAFKAIQDRKAGTMEKIRNVTTQSEDPFYRMKSLNPVLAESESAYTIKVNLPEHEAKNLFVSGEGPYIKISLARRFQDDVKSQEEGAKRATHTNSYQSVVEQIAMPGAYDAKKIERTYQDGVVSIKVPKVAFGEPEKKTSAKPT